MTSAQHLASHVAAHTRSLSADIAAHAGRLWTAGKSGAARATDGFSASEAVTAGGYTLLSLYALGFLVYIASIY
ncbi:hypothetical protein [Parvibaculum sp.]|jgi:hypothetical protein|uniref:hypothetical protein n=1 Tax=Parvibaculum sp. TaxID=2024848 RepID=UPI000C3E2B3C|nr:hypothetical protein [Parvibaculum sp.]MAU62166.1 hypothetical protein [Parvibaculum sp.]MBO6667057.1 hypothetical protein [Parvibaculum sp.]MBO6690501.1 hypothetical protein [Parvibaculum sp.]MBO6716123.1 hypothetical protein [Parvibaculum sp.]|tara:strand:+ start:473 stop:694 length:222 start_codon:yes stop_codon:yes gene_type:complete